jgi:uncharacterized protein
MRVSDPGSLSSPVPSSERIQALDIIRGFALLGVLQMNLVYFSGDAYRDLAGAASFTGPAEAWLLWIRDWLLAGKSISLFSILFGVGLSIQMERARARGAGPGFALRRLSALLLLGTAHSVLIWNGDILHIYALGGLAILPFLGRRPRVPLIWAAALFALGVLRTPVMELLRLPSAFHWSTWQGQAAAFLVKADQAYGAGTWLEACRWRVWEWGALGPFYVTHYLLTCVPLFLGGMALWGSGLLRSPERHLRAIRIGFHGTFWLGLALALGFPAMARLGGADAGGGLLGMALGDLAAYAVAVGYLLGILLLLQRPGWRAPLGLLAPMGRMALTNYLAQSLICSWLFNGHGLGLWNRLPGSVCVLGGCALFAAQVAWSRWWMARFRFGPAEWLWRVLTYGCMQPFRAGDATNAALDGT